MVKREQEIVSFSEYKTLIENFKNKEKVFYRGQADKTYNISCSLSRDYGYVNNENLIIKKTLKIKQKEFEGYKYPVEQLSKMQHYGIPTRLIDITIDPFIALYFAIEDTNNKQDAEVFIFEKEPYDLYSKEANVLSLLSIIDNYDIKNISKKYEEIYKNQITDTEINKIIKENRFIKFNQELSNTNERLYEQKGTFIICSNNIHDGKIEKSIQNIDKDEASCIIRIPFEYKEKIKEELDIAYNINKFTIYPELPSFASYIRETYKEENYNKKELYSVIEKDDVSHALAKRISIKIELKDRLAIQKIKEIVYDVICDQQDEYDVIWVFVSSSEEDTIMSNWTVRAQWINVNLDEKNRPMSIGTLEKDNIYWHYTKGVNFNREWYDKNVFEEDDKLLNDNTKEFKNLKAIYIEIRDSFRYMDFEEFKNIVDNHNDDINQIYTNFTNFGKSRTKDLDKFLSMFQSLACEFHNIIYLYKYEEKRAKFVLDRLFIRIDSLLEEIDKGIEKWIEQLG